MKVFGFILSVSLTLLMSSCIKDTDINCLGSDKGEVLNRSYLGCGNFMVFDSIPGDTNLYLQINVDREALVLGADFSEFQIQDEPAINASIEQFNMPANNYCTDMMVVDLENIKTWNIKSGTAEIRIVREKNECTDTYVIDLLLKNAVFTDSEENEITVDYKAFENVFVNYLIG